MTTVDFPVQLLSHSMGRQMCGDEILQMICSYEIRGAQGDECMYPTMTRAQLSECKHLSVKSWDQMQLMVKFRERMKN